MRARRRVIVFGSTLKVGAKLLCSLVKMFALLRGDVNIVTTHFGCELFGWILNVWASVQVKALKRVRIGGLRLSRKLAYVVGMNKEAIIYYD